VERRSEELSDSTTIREFIMWAVVARRFSEASGRSTCALDGTPPREEDLGQTAALHASPAATRPFVMMLAAVCEASAPNCQSQTTRIRNLSDGDEAAPTNRRIRPGAGRGALEGRPVAFMALDPSNPSASARSG